jgi:hypothetical protein
MEVYSSNPIWGQASLTRALGFLTSLHANAKLIPYNRLRTSSGIYSKRSVGAATSDLDAQQIIISCAVNTTGHPLPSILVYSIL